MFFAIFAQSMLAYFTIHCGGRDIGSANSTRFNADMSFESETDLMASFAAKCMFSAEIHCRPAALMTGVHFFPLVIKFNHLSQASNTLTMLERIALGTKEPEKLCFDYLVKRLTLKFEHVSENGISALFTCVVCTVCPETNSHSLLTYYYEEKQCYGQLHHQHRLKPLILFLCQDGGTYYLLGGMSIVQYNAILLENWCISYGDIKEADIWRFFDDRGLLSMMPSIHCHDFPDMDPSELANLVYSDYCQVEYGVTRKWDEEMHPLVMKYLIALCSASPRLSQALQQYLVNSFVAKLEQIQHNPLILLEFVLKWLQCELPIEFVENYEQVKSSRCADFCAHHNPFEPSCPSFLFTVPISEVLWQLPNNPCIQCNALNCPRSIASRGKIDLPDFMLRHVAKSIYANYLHRHLIEVARSQGTRAAIDVWTRLTMKKTDDSQRETWFIKEELDQLFKEYWNATEKHRRTAVNEHQLRVYLSNAAVNYRALFKIDEHYDPMVFEIIFMVWTELRERRGEIEQHQVSQLVSAINNFSFTVENTEFSQFVDTYWPPCMRNLFHLCKGERHLNNGERTMVSRFLLDCRYESAFARALWREFFVRTDVGDCTDAEFWKGEYGQHFVFQEKHLKKKSYFPRCASVQTLGHCPLGDIEDAAKATCFNMANECRVAMGKPARRNWRIFGPMSIALMKQEN